MGNNPYSPNISCSNARYLKMSDDVLIACKLPFGLHLDLGKQRVTLNGSGKSKEVGSFFSIPSKAYGLTKVPCDFWDAWIKLNGNLDAVKRGYIFANETKKDLKAEAKEKSDLKTGLERIDPDKLPKGVKQIAAGQTT